MKNKIIIYTGLFLAIFLAITSCSEDTTGPLFDMEGNNYVSFGQSTMVALVKPDDVVKVPLYRFDKSKNDTKVVVNVEFMDESDEYITLSSSHDIVFDDGESVAYIEFSFDINNLEFMVDYTVNISIDEEKSNAKISPLSSAVPAINLVIKRALSFTEFGTGNFISSFFDDSWEQPILLAEQAIIYRLTGLYESGIDIDVVMDGNNATITSQLAWNHSQGFKVFIQGDGILNNGVLEMSIEHYIPEIEHSWGSWPELLEMP